MNAVTAGGPLRVRLLGPIEVTRDGQPVELGGPAQRAVLAHLALDCGHVVPVDRLVDRLWADEPPPSAVGTLQGLVSRLRRVLEPQRRPGAAATVLVSEPPGYRLALPRDWVDVFVFEELATAGRLAAARKHPSSALESFDAALACWQGQPLGGIAQTPATAGIVARLLEARAHVVEDRFVTLLALGRHSEVVGPLREAVAVDPYRERLWEQLVLALYRCGRQAEALAAISEARKRLADDLGLDLGPDLRELEVKVLAQDPALLRVPTPDAATGASRGESTSTVADAGRLEHQAEPLVGRDAERALLHALISASPADPATTAAAPVAVVVGEPGIGKTTLLEDLARHAQRSGWTVAWGRCLQDGLAPALWPWVEVVRSVSSSLDPADRAELHREHPYAAALAARSPEPALASGRTGSVVEQAEDVAAFLAACGQVLVLLEDLHWADAATLDLLPLVASRLVPGRTALVVSQRPQEVGGASGAVARVRGSRRLELHGLDQDDAARLYCATTASAQPAATGSAQPPTTGTPAAADLWRRTGGNPLFVTELARLQSRGNVVRDSAGASVPEAVRHVVRQRLEPLPDRTRVLLRTAAVLGTEVDLRVLATAQKVPLDDCLDDVDAAVVTGTLRAEAGAVRFSHDLVREAVLADVSPLQRARLHRRCADALEEVFGLSGDYAEPIAVHRMAAAAVEDPDRICRSLITAGEVTARRGALDRADELCELALAAAGRLPDSPRRRDWEAAALEGMLGVETIRSFMSEGLERMVRRVQEVADRTPGSEAARALALFVRWSQINVSGPVAVLEHAEALRAAGETSASPYVRVLAGYAWGVQCWLSGKIPPACETLSAALALRDDCATVQPPLPPVRLPSVALAGICAMAFECLGDHAAADRCIAELRRRAADGDWTHSVDLAFFGGLTLALRRDAAGVRAVTADVVGARRALRLAHFSPAAVVLSGWAQALLGEPAAGAARAEAAMAEIDAGTARVGTPALRTLYAETLLMSGRPEDAAHQVSRALAQAADLGELWWQPETLRMLALVQRARGADSTQVQATLDAARECAERQGESVLAARVQM